MSAINNSSGDQKKLFHIVNDLLHQKQAPVLPTHSNISELTEAFGKYFVSKIKVIRSELESDSSFPASTHTACSPSVQLLETFAPASEKEVLEIVKSAKNSSCSLDPLPTTLVKECMSSLLPRITHNVNRSLSSGIFPSALKHALVKPLLKKPHLDCEILKNFRPVSNLPFLSKILEKVVAK